MTTPNAPVLGVASSLSGRRWIWREAEERVGLGIAQRLGVPEILGRLLAVRGIGIDAAADFLQPTLRALLEQRDALERQVAELRLRKESMEPARYDQEVEKLLTDLKQRIRDVRQGPDGAVYVLAGSGLVRLTPKR